MLERPNNKTTRKYVQKRFLSHPAKHNSGMLVKLRLDLDIVNNRDKSFMVICFVQDASQSNSSLFQFLVQCYKHVTSFGMDFN